jgi:hypothetical protein
MGEGKRTTHPHRGAMGQTPPDSMKLTTRQERFIREYLIEPNATKAAIDKDSHFTRINFCSVIRASAWTG